VTFSRSGRKCTTDGSWRSSGDSESVADWKIMRTLAFSSSELKSSLESCTASASQSFLEKQNTITGSKFLSTISRTIL